MSSKVADLAGPGISTYEEVAKILPDDYESLLTPKETMKALFLVKRYIEDNLCAELGLDMVQVPLIVDADSGVNDYLDRDGSRTPVEFPCGLGLEKPITAQVVQAATKWKRPGTRPVRVRGGRGDLHRHEARSARTTSSTTITAAYVDQWDWEKTIISPQERSLEFLTGTVVEKIWKVLHGAALAAARRLYPAARLPITYPPTSPRSSTFIHAEDILAMYPDLPRKQRETALLQEYPAVFIYGIGWPFSRTATPTRLRAADYDDWVTETVSKDGRPMHGLNGDILVWNPVTHRRHELTSMGVRVTKETLKVQLELSGQLDFLDLPYHQAILNDEIPLSIGGGIGQARTYMYLLRKAHLGEVTVTVWPKQLKEICAARNIHVLE